MVSARLGSVVVVGTSRRALLDWGGSGDRLGGGDIGHSGGSRDRGDSGSSGDSGDRLGLGGVDGNLLRWNGTAGFGLAV